MNNCGFNFSDIENKKKYVKRRLKNTSNLKERDSLICSLLTYIKLSRGNDTNNLRFTSLANKLTGGHFSLLKDKKYLKMSDLVFDFTNYVYDDCFLLELCQNMIREDQLSDTDLNRVDLSLNELIDISKGFYTWLGDEEMCKYALLMLEKNNHIELVDKRLNLGDFEAGGITYYDSVFDESYIEISLENTLFDAQVLNHEIMHSVDFSMGKKLPSTSYYGFHEVSTYTIDYLFLDYLESMGFDILEVTKLRDRKSNYIHGLASYAMLKLKLRANNGILFKKVDNEDLLPFIDDDIRKNLLEVQSGVIAYLLASKIKEDKRTGLDNLKRFIKTNIPINQTPVFSYIGISKDDLIKTSTLDFVNGVNNVEYSK